MGGRDKTREQRGLRMRAITISAEAMTRSLQQHHIEPLEYDATIRPRTRGECADGPRPCPWVGCRHHLMLEVGPAGSVKRVFGDLEADDLRDTCSLDVADRGQHDRAMVGDRLNITRERVRQIEAEAGQLVRIRMRRAGV